MPTPSTSLQTRLAQQEAELAALRTQLQAVSIERDRYKLRGADHWDTLKTIRSLDSLDEIHRLASRRGRAAVPLEALAAFELTDAESPERPTTPSPASVHVGKAAIQTFLACLNSFFQSDATGNAYAVTRNDTPQLTMLPLTGCAIDDIAQDATNDVTRLNRYNMIVIDSGNSHGDSWKAIFHPVQQVLHFVREVDILPIP